MCIECERSRVFLRACTELHVRHAVTGIGRASGVAVYQVKSRK